MSFLMSYYGIGWYISTVLVAAVAIYIALLKNKAPLHRVLNMSLLILFFTFIVPFTEVFVFHHPAAVFGSYLVGLLPASSIVFTLFIYRFPRNLHPRESRVVMWVLWIVFLISCLAFYPPIFQSKAEFRMASEIWVSDAMTSARVLTVFGLTLIVLMWSIVTALRKAAAFDRETDPRASLFAAWVKPVGEEARGMRNIAAASLLVVACIAFYILARSNLFTFKYRSFLTVVLPMASTICFIQLYIVTIPERISYRAKILGMSLIILLGFLGMGIAWVFRAYEKLAVERQVTAVRIAQERLASGKTFALEGDMKYLARRTDAGYRLIKVAGDTPLPAVLSPTRGVQDGRQAYSRMAFRRYRMAPSGQVYIIRDFRLGGETYQAGFDYLAFRRFMHRITARAMIVVFLALALLLITFPLMLRAGLTAPLDRLLAAVGKVSEGDYSIQLPVRGLDTIGELSTAFNQMSRVIRENTEDLENKVRERTAGLEVSNRKLAEMDRLKTNFFTNLSHELRTPLTLILAPLERIVEGGASELGHETAAGMHRNALRLLNLVNNLLNLSRLDAGGDEPVLRPGDIALYTRELAAGFESAAASRGLYLRVDARPESIMANFDAARLETILLNLLSNAVKFTREGGVDVQVSRREDGVEIAVADTGAGIPDSARELIFDRYGRFEGDSSHYGGGIPGSGIGLALAGELARSHGGRIRLESAPGEGSVFILELPGIASDNASAGARDDKKPEGSSANRDIVLAQLRMEARAPSVRPNSPREDSQDNVPLVLVVEDHDDMRAYLADILSDEYRVVTAVNGREGLAAARRVSPRLIISDVMMPEMNGLELLAALREDENPRPAPFILLTAKAAIADRLAGLGLEADDYITKPFHTEEFLLRARNLIQRTGLLDVLIEKNRLEIYGDLHDHLGARLTDLAILTDKLLTRTRAGGPSAEHEQLLDSLENNIALIRAGFKSWLLEVEDLRLLRDDFIDGLQLSLIRRYSGSERLIRFKASDGLRALLASAELDSLKTILFAAAREITTNDLKYGTGAAEWALTEDGGRVLLSVVSHSNYGMGNVAGAGLGIAGIRRRVEEPGGRLLESLENGLYSLRLELPLPGAVSLN